VGAGAADPFAGKERAETAHRQRGFGRLVADGVGILGHIHHQVVALRETQFVSDQRDAEVVLRRPRSAAFEHRDLEAGRSKLLGEDAAGPTHAHYQDVYRG
jgi:hypothetical protein